MTKVEYTLRPNQELLLRLLRTTGGVEVRTLFRYAMIVALAEAGTEESTLIRLIHRPPSPRSTSFGQEGEKERELQRALDDTEVLGLVSQWRKAFGPTTAKLTDAGERVAKALELGRHIQFRPRVEFRSIVFVACAFGRGDIDRLCDEVLLPACSGIGYRPVRVDLTEPRRTITEAILENIGNAAAIIADLTYARPSVYFEVGYAHGLGVPMLLTARVDHEKGRANSARVHFDLAQYKISFWSLEGQQFSWPAAMDPPARLVALLPARGIADGSGVPGVD